MARPAQAPPDLCNSLKLPRVTEALLHHTAVDAHDLARDVASRVHSEEGDGTCDLRGGDGGMPPPFCRLGIDYVD